MREGATLVRVGLVGISATLLHLAVVYLRMSMTALPTMLANLIAFLCAFALSFTANYYWSFRLADHFLRALVRFFVTSFSALVANSAVLAILLKEAFLSPAASVFIAACVIPILTFLSARFWAFKGTARR